MDPVTDVKLLKVARFKTLAKLLFFTRYFFKKRESRKFVVSTHHEIITDALDRVLAGKCRRLIINIAPRYGKTEIAVKAFMAKGLAHNPTARFIHLSYSDDLALDNSESVKDLVTSDEYQELFPEVQIKKDSKAKKKWYLTKGGGVYATAAAGQVTGFGAGKVDDAVEDADDDEATIEEFTAAIAAAEGELTAVEQMAKFGGALIIDDPIKPEDADSETIRERVNNRWDSTISNRVNSRNTPIVIIMQRLHDQDLCGKLIERDGKVEDGGEWEVISLPCLTTDADGNQVALWEHKHTVAELLEMKRKNPIVFGRQYQQNPQPLEGLLFSKSQLQYYNPATVNLDGLAEYRFFTCDPADDGGDDLSAPFGYLVDTKVYIPFVIYNTDGTDVNQPALVHEIKSRKMNAGVIEGVGAWKLFAKAVRSDVQEDYEDCEIRIIGQSKNKHTRILAMSAWIVNNCVFRDDWEDFPGTPYYRFMKCLTSYMKVQTGTAKAAHDDAPDSLAEIAKHFQSVFAHLY